MVFSPLCYAVRTLQYIFQIKKTILPMKKQMPSKVAYFTAQSETSPMPIPSASSKIFWPCSKCFDLIQYFLNLVKYFWAWSKVIFYLIILHVWAWSKIFDHIQKYWTRSKIFEHIQKIIWTSRWIRHYLTIACFLECSCLYCLPTFLNNEALSFLSWWNVFLQDLNGNHHSEWSQK